MSGQNLLLLDAPDLVDVLHYFYEDDIHNAPMDGMEAVSKVRATIYEFLYEIPMYKYTFEGSDTSQKWDGVSEYDDDDLPVPIDPLRQGKPKGFIPVTRFDPDAADPFHGVLEPPMTLG